MSSGNHADVQYEKLEDQYEKHPHFEREGRRTGFICAVCGILALMLLENAACVAVALYIPTVNDFLEHRLTWWLFLIALFSLYGPVVCWEKIRFRTPYNYITMAVITLSAGFLLAVIMIKSSQDVVVHSGMGTCAAILFGALLTRMRLWDVTSTSFTLVVNLTFILTFIASVIFYWRTFHTSADTSSLRMSISAAWNFVFALCLARDVRLVLGGVREQLNPNDYGHGALQIWIDIYYMFQFNLMNLEHK